MEEIEINKAYNTIIKEKKSRFLIVGNFNRKGRLSLESVQGKFSKDRFGNLKSKSFPTHTIDKAHLNSVYKLD